MPALLSFECSKWPAALSLSPSLPLACAHSHRMNRTWRPVTRTPGIESICQRALPSHSLLSLGRLFSGSVVIDVRHTHTRSSDGGLLKGFPPAAPVGEHTNATIFSQSFPFSFSPSPGERVRQARLGRKQIENQMALPGKSTSIYYQYLTCKNEMDRMQTMKKEANNLPAHLTLPEHVGDISNFKRTLSRQH